MLLRGPASNSSMPMAAGQVCAYASARTYRPDSIEHRLTLYRYTVQSINDSIFR